MLPKRWLRAPLLTGVQQVKLLAEREARVNLAQFALAWVLRRREVSSAIVGATHPEQVAENAAAAECQIAPEIFARAEDILAPLRQGPLAWEVARRFPIYGRGICTTDIRCKRRDLNAGQQFFQYPGFDPYRHPTPLAIAASSAMIAAPSSANRALRSRSRRNRASCQYEAVEHRLDCRRNSRRRLLAGFGAAPVPQTGCG